MKYVASYMLLKLSGADKVTEKDLTAFLKKIDSEVDEAQVKSVVAALEGKNLSELAKNGMGKITSMAASSAAAPASSASAAPAEAKKAEKVVEEEEEIDMDMGDMFG